MSDTYRLYVGNYPNDYTREDVQNLFSNFGKIDIDKCHRKDNKSFAFVFCKDIDQLVSIIKHLNGSIVSGRKLVVRASQESLQNYVNLILGNNEPAILPFSQNNETVTTSRSCNVEPVTISPSSNVNPINIPMPTVIPKQDRRHLQNRKNCLKKPGCKTDTDLNKYFDINSEHYLKPSSPTTQGLKKTDSDDEHYSLNVSSAPQKHNQSKEGKLSNNEFEMDNINSSNILLSDEKTYEYSPRRNLGKSNFSPKSSYSNYDNRSVENKISENRFHGNTYQQLRNTNLPTQKGYQLKGENHRGNEMGIDNVNSPDFSSSDTNTYELSPRRNFDRSSISSESSYGNYNYNNSDNDNKGWKNKSPGKMHQQRNTNSPTWISVINFNWGTSVKTLFELFSDYNPLKVKMICNYPKRARTMTEAHVCFENRDVADDVIMNFDNTMFQGRLLLVSDVDDFTIVNELIDLSCA